MIVTCSTAATVLQPLDLGHTALRLNAMSQWLRQHRMATNVGAAVLQGADGSAGWLCRRVAL